MRRLVELLLRTIAFAALATALVMVWRPPRSSSAAAPLRLPHALFVDTSSRELVQILARALADDVLIPRAHANLRDVPNAGARGVLRAARTAGMGISWTDSTGASGLAVAASAVPDPQGGTVVRALGGRAPRALVLRDAGGVLDSSLAGSLSVRTGRVSHALTAQSGGSRASVVAPEPPILRRVLVLARAGWEAKLAMAALEERGWLIDGRLQLSPSTVVTVGTAGSPDTSRYALVVVLDSGVAPRTSLARYLRQGGGVVFAGDALLDASLASLLPARSGGLRAAVGGALLTGTPRNGLTFRRLTPIEGAVVLQHDGAGRSRTPAVVARRVGAGRSLAAGYRESWRWRMEGTDDGIDEHRSWWNALASAVAFVPVVATDNEVATRLPGDAAPFADLLAGLGAASASPTDGASPARSGSRLWLLFVVAAAALLAEWASRRLRGAA